MEFIFKNSAKIFRIPPFGDACIIISYITLKNFNVSQKLNEKSINLKIYKDQKVSFCSFK